MLIKKKNGSECPSRRCARWIGASKTLRHLWDLENRDFSAMTYSLIPTRGVFDWHHHDGIEEIMLVLTGKGTVEDREGKLSIFCW